MCYEPHTSGLQLCGRGRLATRQRGASVVQGKTWGTAGANAPAGSGGLGCVRTHAALVGPASSLPGRLRRAYAIPAAACTAVRCQRQLQPELLPARPAAEDDTVETAAISVETAEPSRGAAFATAATRCLWDKVRPLYRAKGAVALPAGRLGVREPPECWLARLA